jgi:DNA-directed RNA polymerase subunit E'/Rpb7
MSNSTKITHVFQVSPAILSKNINDEIENLVQSNIVGSCSETRGYITSVSNIVLVFSKISEATGFIDFKVMFDAVCVRPKTGNMYSGRVCLVFDMGILIDVAGILKVLIPVSEKIIKGENKNYATEFNSENSTIILDTGCGKNKIEQGVFLKSKITGVQYNASTKSFNCFGILVLDKQ